MKSTLPTLFMDSLRLEPEPIYKRSQGGMFRLNLQRSTQKDSSTMMNSTFASGLSTCRPSLTKDKKLRKFLHERSISTGQNYRTLPLRTNRYDVSKQRKLINKKNSLFVETRSLHSSLMMENNPQTAESFHKREEHENINSLMLDRTRQVAELKKAVQPLASQALQISAGLQDIFQKVSHQIQEVQKTYTLELHKLTREISSLRRQTLAEIKKNKQDLSKEEQTITTLGQVIDQFPKRMSSLSRQI